MTDQQRPGTHPALEWLESHLSERSERWTALGLKVDREETTEGDTTGVIIDLERSGKEAAITVWSNGEAETVAGDVSGAMEQRRLDLSAEHEVGVALDQLEAYLISAV
ncbi:hypothetical protein K0651_07955 [Ornithinimicrobium sp. Arc0846-15]|nr:hypothetical protein [Ornithinimicrobium laminariae]